MTISTGVCVTTLRRILLIAPLVLLGGCWNGENVHVRLGDVSLGQQLIDLKSALERGAISEDEFEETKLALLALNTLCEGDEDDD